MRKVKIVQILTHSNEWSGGYVVALTEDGDVYAAIGRPKGVDDWIKYSDIYKEDDLPLEVNGDPYKYSQED